jgi:hypothetical protein
MVTLSTLFLVIGILLAMLAGFAIAKLHSWLMRIQARLNELEKAQSRRLPYKSADAIEDATASLMYLEQQKEIFDLWLAKAHEYLKKARNPDGIK